MGVSGKGKDDEQSCSRWAEDFWPRYTGFVFSYSVVS